MPDRGLEPTTELLTILGVCPEPALKIHVFILACKYCKFRRCRKLLKRLLLANLITVMAISKLYTQDRDSLVDAEQQPEEGGEGGLPQGDFVSDLLQSSYHRHRPGTGEMRHGTEGWQALETSFVVRANANQHCH